MKTEDIEMLKEILKKLRDDTEDYISHDRMINDADKYLLIIAIEKYLYSNS